MGSVNNYETFEKELLKVLNNRAPIKKKFVSANHLPYMTKALRKAIVKRSLLESEYLKNSTFESRNRYKKQKKSFSKLYKNTKRNVINFIQT